MKERNNSKREKNESDAKGKPFDKKKYRLQKYSCKFKVNEWEERRKKVVVRNFYKELKKDKNVAVNERIFDRKNVDIQNQGSSDKKRNGFFAAKAKFEKKKEEKRKMREATLKAIAEKEEALKKYKEKRTQIYKKLSRKTKKGQPIMRDRMELLFEKIQHSVQN